MNGETDSLKAKQIELSLNYHKKKKTLKKNQNKTKKTKTKKTRFICFSDTVLK